MMRSGNCYSAEECHWTVMGFEISIRRLWVLKSKMMRSETVILLKNVIIRSIGNNSIVPAPCISTRGFFKCRLHKSTPTPT
ncbi:hypothetical protein Tco_1442681, partial [Tanacetum coccineum]